MRKQRNFLFLVLILIIVAIASPVQAKTKIALNVKKKTLVVGKTYTLKVKGTKKKVKWSTSKKSVATVSKKGKVKAKKAGIAIIKAKVAGKTLKCKINVKKKTSATKKVSTNTTEAVKPTTPAEKPTTPAVEPTVPTDEPATPVDENFNRLVDYINDNGAVFDDHMLAISKMFESESKTEISVVAYDNENKRVVFMYMTQGGTLNQLSYMYIKSSSSDEKTNLCNGVEKGDDSYVVVTPDFAKKSYEPAAFSYTVAEQTGVFATNESLCNMANTLFSSTESIQFIKWNTLLEPVGLSMRDLGFSLIN